MASSPTPSAPPRGESLVVTVLFWCYAVTLVLVARSFIHHWLTGWPARLATMAIIAIGLAIPWGRWLQPRIIWCLGWSGRALLVGVYLGLLWPMALIARRTSNTFRSGQSRTSQWRPRRPLPNTLDAARLEY